jgi:uncharacterized protein involved in exopolysaccharide biosynthesis
MDLEKRSTDYSDGGRILISALFTHWRLILFVPVMCSLLTVGACKLLPSFYTGGFSLLVKAPEVDRTAMESGTSVVLRPGLVLENVIADEIKILQSHELFLNVAKILLKEDIYLGGLLDAARLKYNRSASGRFDKTEDKVEESKEIEAVAAALKSFFVVAPVRGSDIIEVTIRHYDPPTMRSILGHYLKAFYQLRETVWYSSDAPDFFQASSDYYYLQWQNLLNERVVLEHETVVNDPTREKEILIEKQAAYAAEIYDLQATLNDLQSQMKRLDKLSPEQSLTFLQNETVSDKLFSQLKLQIATIQTERARLLGDFTQNALLVKKVDFQLEVLFRRYYVQLFTLIKNQLASVQTRMRVLRSSLAQVKKKLVELDRYANQIQMLDKKIELYRKHYVERGNRAMEIKQQKDLRKNVATVNVVSKPYVNAKPHWPKPTILAPLAFALGLFLSLFSVVLLRYLKNAYHLPEEISRDLSLPVLASYNYLKK